MDALLRSRAAARLGANDVGDDTFGSITHLMAYIDDLSTLVPLVDLAFFLKHCKRLAKPLGCDMYAIKTRIQTSCTGASAIPAI